MQGTSAAAARDEEAEKIADLQEHLDSLKKKQEDLKLQYGITKKRIREAEVALKLAEQMERQSCRRIRWSISRQNGGRSCGFTGNV